LNEQPSATDTLDLPTREDVQELRQAIESLRDHVQIVWQAIDEVREVIEQVVGHEAAEFWNVEPPNNLPLGRYRPFAGYGPFDENDGNDTPPAQSEADDSDEVFDTDFPEDTTQFTPSDTQRDNGHYQIGAPPSNGQQHQRSLWDAAASATIEQAPTVEADNTPQNNAIGRLYARRLDCVSAPVQRRPRRRGWDPCGVSPDAGRQTMLH
jgi:hypothetical protein